MSLTAHRVSKVRASAGRMLSSLVDSFPHLQWSSAAVCALFDTIDVVTRHALLVNVVAAEAAGSSACGDSITVLGTHFLVDAPSARAPLLAIMSGKLYTSRTGLPNYDAIAAGQAERQCFILANSSFTDLTTVASRWLVIASNKVPEEAQGVIQVGAPRFLTANITQQYDIVAIFQCSGVVVCKDSTFECDCL